MTATRRCAWCPSPSNGNEPDMWAPMGIALAGLPQVACRFPRTRPSWCPIQCGSPNSARDLPQASGQEGGHLLALDDAGSQARQIFQPHRWLGAGAEDARRQLRQSSIWRLRRRDRPRRQTNMASQFIRSKGWTCATISTAPRRLPRRWTWCCPRPPPRRRRRPAWAPRSGSSPPAAPGRNWGPTNIPGMPTPACLSPQKFGDWAALMPRRRRRAREIRR